MLLLLLLLLLLVSLRAISSRKWQEVSFGCSVKDEERRAGALKVFSSFTAATLRLRSLRSSDSHAASLAAADVLQPSQVENITR